MQQKIWQMTLTEQGDHETTVSVPHDEMVAFLNGLIYGSPSDTETDASRS